MIGGRLKNCTVSVLLLVFACMPRERRKQRPLPRDALSLHAAVLFLEAVFTTGRQIVLFGKRTRDMCPYLQLQ